MCVCVFVCTRAGVCLYARARAYVQFVCVLNQYFNTACRLSWVSQFDGILLYFILFLLPYMLMMYVKINIYIQYMYILYVQFVCRRQMVKPSKVILFFWPATARGRGLGEAPRPGLVWSGLVIPRAHV